MKVSELRKKMEEDIEDNVTPSRAIGLFNSALRDLATVARIHSKAVIAIPTDQTAKEVPLPTNIVELREVFVEFDGLDGSPFKGTYKLESAGYGLSIYENAAIEWADVLPSGRFLVRYYRYPIMLNSDIDIPEIGEIFHDALVYFAIREYQKTDDELELAKEADKAYQAIKAELDRNTRERGTAEPRRSDPRPPWARR